LTATFTIDIWSDVVCPFCYLGKANLEQALLDFEHRDHVVRRYRAFELDPNARAIYDEPLPELIARKYGIAVEQASASQVRLEAQALDMGMRWSLANARHANSFDAHRLIALANAQDKQLEMVERLFRAYFSEAELISDHATLIRLASDVGVVGASELLNSDDYGKEVRIDQDEALELGISGVPSMLLDGRFMVVGAQPPETLLDVLRRAWARREVL
jgi:predicted DsbA family dithiol-disulfide isomerase